MARRKNRGRLIPAPATLFEPESESDMSSEQQASQRVSPAQNLAPAPAPPMEYRKIVIIGDKDAQGDVFVQPNGKGHCIRRNQVVCLPADVLAALYAAEAPNYYNSPGLGVMETPPFPRYQIMDKGPGTEAEYRKMMAEKLVMSDSDLPRVTPVVRQLQRAFAQSSL